MRPPRPPLRWAKKSILVSEALREIDWEGRFWAVSAALLCKSPKNLSRLVNKPYFQPSEKTYLVQSPSFTSCVSNGWGIIKEGGGITSKPDSRCLPRDMR